MAGEVSFGDVAWDDTGTLIWLEKRSDRNALVVQEPGLNTPRDLNVEFSARSGIGYGGGAFSVTGGYVFLVDAESGRVFRQPLSATLPQPITPVFGAAAAPTLSPDGRWLLYVHSDAGADSLAIVDARGVGWPGQLVTGDDFYMQPCWHPAGDRVAWIAWNHPQMPWDGAILHVADLKTYPGALPLVADTTLTIGNGHTAVFQPQFSSEGRSLAYVSDEEGFWQLYLMELSSGEVQRLTDDDQEYGLPAWLQGMRTYDFSRDGKIIYAVRHKNGFASLVRITLQTRVVEEISLDPAYTWLEQPAVSPDGEQVALIASGSQVPPRVITVRPGGQVQVLARSAAEDLPVEVYPVPEHLSWETSAGSLAHGLYYLPNHPRFTGDGPPPLIISVHGGPTSQAAANFEPRYAFLTSRGYAVLAVNFRGSTGYGRAYRQALQGNWGVYDVEDAVSGARRLLADGRVDADRLAIEGGSAGGFTVLLALIRYPGFFKGGICRYPLVNMLAMGDSSFKFEAHYLDTLIGPLPKTAPLYKERSPLFHADKIEDPLLLFHGENDPVVPKEQSEALVSILRKRGIPHEFHIFAGEGHGFRKLENIVAYYEAVDLFLKANVVDR
jgi:dipeptidyl aminopeptidase/acylaminoacyl peptidase